MDLTELRAAIDEVDGELLTLLHRRAEISRMVGAAKKDEGGPVFRPEREQEVVERLLRINRESRGEGLPDEHIARIWREIFSSSRALQRPLRAAFLGPEGTFSHMAALECLGHSISAAPCENFDAVFRAVAEGTCDLGLVPLENSLHGSIGQCIDLFAEYDVHVVGEHYSRIRLCLMSRESGLSAVRRVYSHPQPFGQSRGWLRAHLPGAALMPEESTAAAALRVRDEAGSAAIGHPGLASMLGLDVLADSLEDSTSNWTRFAVIAPGREARSPRAEPGTALKTSLLFTVAHRPGTLAAVLNILSGAGINLSELESRPMRGSIGEYVFFLDAVCDLLRPEHAETLKKLRECCQSLRVLGVYPHETPRSRG